MSFHFLFGIIKNHILYLIQVIHIVVTSQKFRCLMIDGTYLFIFNHVEFIHHVVNNSMVLFFFLKPFFRYGIAPAVLHRLGHSVLSSKLPQILTLTIRMSEAMVHTVFRCALWEIYILFTALSSALILCGVSVWRCGFSSLIPTDYSTVGFCPISFFIRRCYQTFINTFSDFHMIKHIYSLLKNSFIIKTLYIRLFWPDVWRTV